MFRDKLITWRRTNAPRAGESERERDRAGARDVDESTETVHIYVNAREPCVST